jgi:hypothetical protein
MLYGYPDLYHDEPLLSACARYRERMRGLSCARLMTELFGSPIRSCPIDFPTHVNHVVEQLPPGHRLTVDQIVDGHTLYPFAAPFLPPARAARLREEMKAGIGRSQDRRLLIGRRSSVSVPEYLRYCPSCVTADRARLGECYWHRVHQVPGVEVCPTHDVWLESSTVPAWTPQGNQRMLSAEKAMPSASPRPLSAQEPGRTSVLALARNVGLVVRPSAALAGRADVG